MNEETEIVKYRILKPSKHIAFLLKQKYDYTRTNSFRDIAVIIIIYLCISIYTLQIDNSYNNVH